LHNNFQSLFDAAPQTAKHVASQVSVSNDKQQTKTKTQNKNCLR